MHFNPLETLASVGGTVEKIKSEVRKLLAVLRTKKEPPRKWIYKEADEK